MRLDEAIVKAIRIMKNERPHCGNKSTFTESELCEAYTLALTALRAPTVPKIGRWKQVPIGMSPGGTPGFVCDNCGGSFHLHGAEYPERKLVCDECWQVNAYPWEKIMEDSNE